MSEGFSDANPLQRGLRTLAGTRPMAWLLARTMHHLDGPVMRRSDGRSSVTSLITGLPMVQLTTTGARSGLPRTLPIIGVPDGDRLVLVASNYGQARNPAWYHNLTAHPDCSVAFRGRVTQMTAYEAEGEPFTVHAYRLWREEQIEGLARWEREKYPGYHTIWNRYGTWASACNDALGPPSGRDDDPDDDPGAASAHVRRRPQPQGPSSGIEVDPIAGPDPGSPGGRLALVVKRATDVVNQPVIIGVEAERPERLHHPGEIGDDHRQPP